MTRKRYACTLYPTTSDLKTKNEVLTFRQCLIKMYEGYDVQFHADGVGELFDDYLKEKGEM